MTTDPLPYGVADLDPDVVVHPDNSDVVRCYVRGCSNFLHRQTRDGKGELCPDHGIYLHYSGGSPTYSYADVRRNIIASPEQFATRIVGHPFKYESNRLAMERSEDALSWNVFRSLSEASCLAHVASLLVGEDYADEPDLYLWGVHVNDDSFEPWDLLIAARERFETDLPVERPLTEPDIALHLPGRYLVLIEAKFTSPNPVYKRGSRQNGHSLTLDELLDIYWDPSLRILDRALAATRDEVHYQLWRNLVFAEWMAALDSRSTRPYHVNLVREKAEVENAQEFASLVRGEHCQRFQRRTWEGIGNEENVRSIAGGRLLTYLANKTAGLRRAFD